MLSRRRSEPGADRKAAVVAGLLCFLRNSALQPRFGESRERAYVCTGTTPPRPACIFFQAPAHTHARTRHCRREPALFSGRPRAKDAAYCPPPPLVTALRKGKPFFMRLIYDPEAGRLAAFLVLKRCLPLMSPWKRIYIDVAFGASSTLLSSLVIPLALWLARL